MAGGRLSLLFLFLPLITWTNRADSCPVKTTMRIVKCGNLASPDHQWVLFDGETCEGGVDPTTVYSAFSIYPLSSTRWRIDQTTRNKNPLVNPGVFDGDFSGPVKHNDKMYYEIRSPFWEDEVEKIELENQPPSEEEPEFVASNSAMTVKEDTVWALGRSLFTLDVGNGPKKYPMDRFAEILEHNRLDCACKNGDLSACPKTTTTDTTTTTTDPSTTSTSSEPTTTASKEEDNEGSKQIIKIVGAVSGVILFALIIAVVIIVVICVKKSKKMKQKNEAPKTDVPKNHSYDRNSPTSETWEEKKERERQKALASLKRKSKQSTTRSSVTPTTTSEMASPKRGETSLGSFNGTITTVNKSNNSLGSFKR